MIESISMFYESDNNEISDGKDGCCFFTGHRDIPLELRGKVTSLVKSNISYLYSNGVREFHTGGALGFDTLAAAVVIDMKRYSDGMTLILDLPYPNQSEKWQDSEKRIYEFIKQNADKINYVSKEPVYTYDDAKKFLLARNRKMADCCSYCIAYYSGNQRSGTGYTVNYAKAKGLEIINIFEKGAKQ